MGIDRKKEIVSGGEAGVGRSWCTHGARRPWARTLLLQEYARAKRLDGDQLLRGGDDATEVG